MMKRLPAWLLLAGVLGAAIVANFGIAAADVPPTPTFSLPPVMIIIYNYGFVPSTVTVKPGTEIGFRNDDASQSHVVASTSGAFASRNLPRGVVYVITLTKPGKYPIFASDAPFMKGQIIVTDASGNAQAAGASEAPAASPAATTPSY
jgi:hypothetical protein